MTLSAQTLQQFHEELASKEPTPGGGAVAAISAATAAALAHMVVNYSFTRKLEPHHATLQAAATRLQRAQSLLMTLADEDAAAYQSLAAALKLPKDDPTRAQALPAAALVAIQVPLAIMAAVTDLLRLMTTLPERSNPHLHSDLSIAADLAATACRAGEANVRVNLPFLGEESGFANEAATLRDTADTLAAAVIAACR